MKRKENPNRMTLLKLRRRLDLSKRGHRLLKNKQEKLMQNFFSLVRETTDLRRVVEKAFLSLGAHYIRGRAATDRQSLEDALELSTRRGTLGVSMRYEMSVRIPEFDFTWPENDPAYTLTGTSPEIDVAFGKLYASFPTLLKLAEKENALFHLSEELEKTRRRVNALEYVMIPDLEESIKSIESKLGENERASQTRMMKIKDMVQQREAGKT